LEQHNLPILTNSLIDTMQLSRTINPDLASHRLGTIARSLKIDYDDSIAHRADFDAKVLYDVWQSFKYKLSKMGISNIEDINNKLQTSNLYSTQFANIINIYCKNQSGIKNLYKIISESLTTNLYSKPRVFKNELISNKHNLFITNSPTESDL
jgi:DNA polymerase-3 subunit alpha (Gram-positive type)